MTDLRAGLGLIQPKPAQLEQAKQPKKGYGCGMRSISPLKGLKKLISPKADNKPDTSVQNRKAESLPDVVPRMPRKTFARERFASGSSSMTELRMSFAAKDKLDSVSSPLPLKSGQSSISELKDARQQLTGKIQLIHDQVHVLQKYNASLPGQGLFAQSIRSAEGRLNDQVTAFNEVARNSNQQHLMIPGVDQLKEGGRLITKLVENLNYAQEQRSDPLNAEGTIREKNLNSELMHKDFILQNDINRFNEQLEKQGIDSKFDIDMGLIKYGIAQEGVIFLDKLHDMNFYRML